jgi:putative transposase
VLRGQGCPVAARTYRSWRKPDRRVASRTVTDAQVINAVRDVAWQPDPKTGKPRLTAEGLYGRRKMTALLRRTVLPAVSEGSVDRAMRTLGLVGVRRERHPDHDPGQRRQPRT